MVDGVPLGGQVALAVGDEFHDPRHRFVLGGGGAPQPRGEFGAIAHRDPQVFDLLHVMGQGGDGPHSILLVVVSQSSSIRTGRDARNTSYLRCRSASSWPPVTSSARAEVSLAWTYPS